MDLSEICANAGEASSTSEREGTRMIFPGENRWDEGRQLCHRFGGRLHVDSSEEGVVTSHAMVMIGEEVRPERCRRVWVGASDQQEEGAWRDANTGQVLDLSRFWAPGQPNGVRVQNCAGIFENEGLGHNRYDDGSC